ncbi:MAG: four helix bundle protein [Ignavibacteria bacterium]
MKENVILEKSYKFAVRIINLYLYLKDKKEFELGNQILRSGTSIGSNVEEAIGGYSRKDFSAKLGIAYREARETSFRLRLLHDTGFIDSKLFNSLFEDCEEILKILGSIQKTLKTSNS